MQDSNEHSTDGIEQKELARIVIEWDDSERSLPSLIADIREAVGDDAEIIDARSTKGGDS